MGVYALEVGGSILLFILLFSWGALKLGEKGNGLLFYIFLVVAFGALAFIVKLTLNVH